MKKFTSIILLFTFIGFFTLPARTLAENTSASLSFATPEITYIGDTFEVLINTDTAGVLINSINLSLEYVKSLISFVGYNDENTVVKLWVDTPHEAVEGQILMSGIIPGGVSGLYDPNKQGISPVPLVHLLFTADKGGDAKISFLNTEILKHDGKGTALVHEQKNNHVLISNNNSKVTNDKNSFDKSLPDPFTITFLSSSIFSRTPDMIIFNTNDVDSGIKEYKMSVSGGDWQATKSPQSIAKSIFSRDITVRAYDFFGNFRDANIIIPGIVPLKVLLLIAVLFLLSGILGYKLLKYRT